MGQARRQIRSVVATAAVLVLAFGGLDANAARADGRFKVARETVLPLLKSVGVEPTLVRADVPSKAEVAARIDGEIIAWLALAGYEGVPASEMEPIEARARRALGGLYDPQSGRLDSDKAAAFREFVHAEYRLKHAVDAFVRATVVERQVSLVGGAARWDGVSDSITGESGLTAFLVGSGAEGHVAVLSLELQVTDALGRVLYSSAGGLQVLTYGRRSLEAREFEYGAIEPRYVMADPVRERRAIAVALDPLASAPDSPAHAKRAPEPRPIPATGPARPSAKDLTARYPAIALARTDTSRLSAAEHVEPRLTEALRTGLARLGITASVAEDYAKFWSDERARAGGYYDPLTGAVDLPKLKASRKRVIEQLGGRGAVSALVLAAVENRMAPFSEGYAAWDGVSEMVSQTFLGNSIFGAGRFSGTLEALSLRVVIVDSDGELLYEGFGGLQLLTKLDSSTRVPVDPGKLLTEPAHDARAVEIALHGLVPPKDPERATRP